MDQRKLGLALMALGAVVVLVGIVWLVTGDDTSDPPAAAESSPPGATSTGASTTTTTAVTSATRTTTKAVTSATTTTTTTARSTETPEEFLALLNGAFATGDAATLLGRLNQATIDIYGQDACDTYLTGIVQSSQPVIAIDDVADPAPWDYVIDGITTPVPDVTTVQASRQRGDETESLELHWKLVDGRYTWFTDCGEPLPS